MTAIKGIVTLSLALGCALVLRRGIGCATGFANGSRARPVPRAAANFTTKA